MNFDARIEQILKEVNTGLVLIDEGPDHHLYSGVTITSPRVTLSTKDGITVINNTPTVEIPYEDALRNKYFNSTFTALLKSLVKSYKCKFEKAYFTVTKAYKKTGQIRSSNAIVEGLDPYGNKIYILKMGKRTLNTSVYFDDYSKATYTPKTKVGASSFSLREFLTSIHPKIENYTVKQLLKLILGRGSKYSIRPDGTIDVQGDIRFRNSNYVGPLRIVPLTFNSIPLKFGKVTGSADFYGDTIGSGKNLPEEVEGDLNITINFYNNASTLESVEPFNSSNLPKYVGGKINLYGLPMEDLQNFPVLKNNDSQVTFAHLHNLKNFNGFPNNFFGVIHISSCLSITSLEGLPKIIAPSVTKAFTTNQVLVISQLDGLKNLVGMPETIKGNVLIHNCENLVSLEGISKVIEGDLYILVDTLGIKNNWEAEFLKHNLGDVVQGDIRLSQYSWSKNNKPIDKSKYSQAYKDALYKGGLEDVPIDI